MSSTSAAASAFVGRLPRKRRFRDGESLEAHPVRASYETRPPPRGQTHIPIRSSSPLREAAARAGHKVAADSFRKPEAAIDFEGENAADDAGQDGRGQSHARLTDPQGAGQGAGQGAPAASERWQRSG